MSNQAYGNGEVNASAIHNISSNIRQKGKNASLFRRKKRDKLDFERYLTGRSYQLFKRGIKTEKTLGFYNRNLFYFCEFLKLTTEEIAEKYGPYVKVKGKNRPNLEGLLQFQKLVENYVLMLQERVDNGEIKPTSCISHMPAIRLFCDMNEIDVKWRKVNKLLPRADSVATDEAYSRDQIKKMLEFCDLRTRIILLFLASSGMRLGGLAGSFDNDTNPIFEIDSQFTEVKTDEAEARGLFVRSVSQLNCK